jgi:uncharacterized protein
VPRRLGFWLAAIGASAIVFTSLAGIILCRIFLRHMRQPVPTEPGALSVEIKAEDATLLRAWLLTPSRTNGSAILILHGSGTNRASQLGLAKLFLAHGYSVLMPDNRGHGESGGDVATYGVRETGDVRRWVSWLIETAHPASIFGIGESLGGAVLIQSLALEPRFTAIAAECSYASFERVLRDRIAELLAIPSAFGRLLAAPPVWAMFLYARVRYGVDLNAASPEAAIGKSATPILLIHGLSDTQTPPEHSRILASKDPAHTVLWLVPGAVHTGAYSAAPQEFENRVFKFFDAARK